MGTHPIFESDFDCLTEMKLLFLFGLALAQNGTETTTAASEVTTGAVPIDTTTAPSAETTRPVPETTKPTTTPSEVTTTAAPIDPIPTGEDGIVRVRKDNETCAMVQFEGSYTLDDVTGTISSNNSALMPTSTCEKPIIQSEGALLTLEFNYTTTANGNQNVTTWDIASVSLTFDGVEYDGEVEGMQAHAGSSYSCQTGFNTTLTAPNLNNSTYRLVFPFFPEISRFSLGPV